MFNFSCLTQASCASLSIFCVCAQDASSFRITHLSGFRPNSDVRKHAHKTNVHFRQWLLKNIFLLSLSAHLSFYSVTLKRWTAGATKAHFWLEGGSNHLWTTLTFTTRLSKGQFSVSYCAPLYRMINSHRSPTDHEINSNPNLSWSPEVPADAVFKRLWS